MKKYTITYLSSAQNDINEVVRYIAVELSNEAAAENLIVEIEDKTELLANGVWSGQSLKNHTSGLFMDIDMNWCKIGNYYLFFRVDKTEMCIRVYYFSHRLRGLDHILKEMHE